MSYRTLEVYKLAHLLVIDIHHMSLHKFPRFEIYEEGRQIRRSSKSVKSNIVEGYGRRRYKQDFIRYLTYAIASNDETIDHLDNLFQTQSLNDINIYNDLSEELNKLGKKLNLFLQTVNRRHISEK